MAAVKPAPTPPSAKVEKTQCFITPLPSSEKFELMGNTMIRWFSFEGVEKAVDWISVLFGKGALRELQMKHMISIQACEYQLAEMAPICILTFLLSENYRHEKTLIFTLILQAPHYVSLSS